MANYQAFSASVQGATHVKKNIVMQDASGKFENEKVKLIVVSDGHGDSSCFRSDRGSRLIVEVGIEELKAFADEMDGTEGELEETKNREIRVRQLIQRIITRWNIEVEKDLENDPVSEEEYQLCSNKAIRESYKKGMNQNGMYGATFLAVLATKNYILALHQGDGRCLMMDQNGQVTYPVPWDDRCYGRNTTSICNRDAAESTRYYYLKIDEKNCPAAVFLASDGIEDSYRTLELSQCFYREVCEKLVLDGVESTTKWLLERELYQVSLEGSGDDMSVAGVADTELVKLLLPFMKKKCDQMACEERARKAKEHLDSMQGKRNYLKKKYDEALERQKKITDMRGDEATLEAEKARKLNLYEQLEKAASQLRLVEETLQKLRIHKNNYENIEAEYKECEKTIQMMEKGEEAKSQIAQELNQISKEYQEYEERYQSYQKQYDDAMADADKLKNEQKTTDETELEVQEVEEQEVEEQESKEQKEAVEEQAEEVHEEPEKETVDIKETFDEKEAYGSISLKEDEEKKIALQKVAIDDYIKDTQM